MNKPKKPGRKLGWRKQTDDPLRSVTVRLELSLREKARKLGNGSITKGIRAALAEAGETTRQKRR